MESFDPSVIRDAARQLEAAARRLRSVAAGSAPAATRALSEARSLIHAAEARLVGQQPACGCGATRENVAHATWCPAAKGGAR